MLSIYEQLTRCQKKAAKAKNKGGRPRLKEIDGVPHRSGFYMTKMLICGEGYELARRNGATHEDSIKAAAEYATIKLGKRVNFASAKAEITALAKTTLYSITPGAFGDALSSARTTELRIRRRKSYLKRRGKSTIKFGKAQRS